MMRRFLWCVVVSSSVACGAGSKKQGSGASSGSGGASGGGSSTSGTGGVATASGGGPGSGGTSSGSVGGSGGSGGASSGSGGRSPGSGGSGAEGSGGAPGGAAGEGAGGSASGGASSSGASGGTGGTNASCVREITGYVLRDDQTVWDLTPPLEQVLEASSEVSLGGVVDIASGTRHGCAVDEHGGAWCWAGAGSPDNSNGELGDNMAASTYVDHRARPVLRQADEGPEAEPVELDDVLALDQGTDECLGTTNCAVTTGGELWCWGHGNSNTFNSLSGSVSESRIAIPIFGEADMLLEGVDQVSALFNHICALADGSVLCWGTNTHGRLGQGDETARKYPTEVELPDAATKVAVGEAMSCALLEDETVWCWGFNRYGQLGIGDPLAVDNDDGCSFGCKRTPVQVKTATGLLGRVVDLVVGARNPLGGSVANMHDSACALDEDGSVWCWGYQYPDVATQQIGLGDIPITGAQALSMCGGAFRYLDLEGRVLEWQPNASVSELPAVCEAE